MDGKANCIICKEPLDQGPDSAIFTLGEKGRANLERNDSTICTVPGQQVHQYCRKILCNPNKIAQAKREAAQTPDTSISPNAIQRKRASVSAVIAFSVERLSMLWCKGKKERSLA